MRQEFDDPTGWLRRQPLEYVTHVGVRVKPVELRRVEQAPDCGGAFPRSLAGLFAVELGRDHARKVLRRLAETSPCRG
jgi:hypothetical protein